MQHFVLWALHLLYIALYLNNDKTQCLAQGLGLGNQPTGCDFTDRQLVCDYADWDPPLSDSDLSNTDANRLHSVVVENVDGAIPTEAFSGLDGPSPYREETFIEFDCASQDIHLGINTFTTNLDWIDSLYIKLCYIQSGLPSNVFEQLSGLTKLEITGGGIPGSIHSDSLAGLEAVTDLTINADFPENTLSSGFLSGVINVENVDLKSSGLTNVTENAFSGLYAIKTLDLSSNAIDILPESILDDMTDLETLDLSANALTSIPEFLFAYTIHLTSLDISRNSITSLQTGILDSLTLLETFDLSENSLQTLPDGIFDIAVALESIDLSQNSLDSLPGGLFNTLVNLRTLDLRDNALTTLPENLFNPLISVTSVSLTVNQWDCSTCDLLWLSTWTFYTGVAHSVVCNSPSIYNGTELERAMLALNCTSGSQSAITFSSGETTTQTSADAGTGTGNTADDTSSTADQSSSNTGESGSSSSSSSSSDSSLSLWETVTIAVSGVAILLSILTVIGTCVAYNKVTGAVERSLGPDAFSNKNAISPRGRKMFSRSSNQTDVHPYIDVHYNRKF